ncbi:hypothetical protein EDB85DRAFT_1938044 [Lactarius pseudohatsudake]|nr:hypothetical protein EDB85DRAFT_1938044 [Lactarius pseudohatsudake]
MGGSASSSATLPGASGCSGDSQALYAILLSTLLRCFADEISVDPFRASTAVSRRTGPSTCDVYRRTGVHFTPAGRSKSRRRFQSAWYRSGARKTVFGRVCTASPGMALVTHTHEYAHPALWLRLLVSMRYATFL